MQSVRRCASALDREGGEAVTKERWRRVIIPKTKKKLNSYEVSDRGRVRSVSRTVHWRATRIAAAHSRFHTGRVLRPSRKPRQGYMIVDVGRQHRAMRVHMLVARAFLGPTPSSNEVRHRDGDPENNRLTNLRFGNRADNNRDIVFHGNRKVTVATIRSLRIRSARGWSVKRLAQAAEISTAHVWNILKRRCYAHVK